MSAIVVSAVVVAYANPHELRACLRSLVAALDAVDASTELIVVDNSSPGSEVGQVAREVPQARWLRQATNTGFAAGVQRGIEAARGRWVLTLNDDATIDRRALAWLLDAGESASDVGSVAAHMRFAGSQVTNSAGIVVDALGVASDRLLGATSADGPWEPVEVFGASAGAALYRTSMLASIGGFDTSFFGYLEDVDVAWRARMAGWRALHCPAALVAHHHSASFGHGSPAKHRLVGRNRVRLLAKNMDARRLRRTVVRIVAHDAAHVLYVMAMTRSLAPLAGRMEGLREWRRYRRAGASGRRPVALASAAGLRGALRRNRAWTRRSPASPPEGLAPPR